MLHCARGVKRPDTPETVTRHRREGDADGRGGAAPVAGARPRAKPRPSPKDQRAWENLFLTAFSCYFCRKRQSCEASHSPELSIFFDLRQKLILDLKFLLEWNIIHSCIP